MMVKFSEDKRVERLKCRIEEFLANYNKQGKRIKKRKMKSYNEAAESLKGRLREKFKEFREEM